jgi:hypothetical protein
MCSAKTSRLVRQQNRFRSVGAQTKHSVGTTDFVFRFRLLRQYLLALNDHKYKSPIATLYSFRPQSYILSCFSLIVNPTLFTSLSSAKNSSRKAAWLRNVCCLEVYEGMMSLAAVRMPF